MKIEWLGLSCFKITSNGASVVLDPFTGVRGYGEVHTLAGLALKSHDHGDHAFLEGVELVDEPQGVFDVTKLASFHDDVGGKKRGPNVIHVLSAEGLRVAHLGDLGHLPDEALVDALKGVEVLLIPVGGFFTIDAKTAKTIADQIAPKAIVPMHYREGECGHAVIGTLDEFLSLYNKEEITRLDGNSFEVGDYSGVVVPKFEG